MNKENGQVANTVFYCFEITYCQCSVDFWFCSSKSRIHSRLYKVKFDETMYPLPYTDAMANLFTRNYYLTK